MWLDVCGVPTVGEVRLGLARTAIASFYGKTLTEMKTRQLSHPWLNCMNCWKPCAPNGTGSDDIPSNTRFTWSKTITNERFSLLHVLSLYAPFLCDFAG
jgi:hypothetical protein